MPDTQMTKPTRDGVFLPRPDVAARLIDMIAADDVPVQKIKELCCQDVGMVSRILTMANSAYYSLPRKVDSIDRAIVLLGVGTIGELAVAATMEQTLNNLPKDFNAFSGAELNDHCLEVARAGEMICRFANVAHMAGEVFVCGILHDIGMISQAWQHGAYFETAFLNARQSGRSITAEELSLTGTDHSKEGASLTESWGLPESICNSIRHHHSPLEAEEDTLQTSILFLAEYLVDSKQVQDMSASPEDEKVASVLSRLRISTDEWDELLDLNHPHHTI